METWKAYIIKWIVSGELTIGKKRLQEPKCRSNKPIFCDRNYERPCRPEGYQELDSLALLVPRYRTDPATGALIMKTHEFILLCLELISLASRGQVWAGPEMSLCQAHFGGSLLKCTSPSSHVSCASPLPLLSDLNRFTEQKCRIMGPNFISGT